jgi:hypothetical protein
MSSDDQSAILLSYLGISCSDERFDAVMCDKVLAACGGVQLALAIAAAYVRSDLYNWNTVVQDLSTFLPLKIRGGHPGWNSVFGAILSRLDRDREFGERQTE